MAKYRLGCTYQLSLGVSARAIFFTDLREPTGDALRRRPPPITELWPRSVLCESGLEMPGGWLHVKVARQSTGGTIGTLRLNFYHAFVPFVTCPTGQVRRGSAPGFHDHLRHPYFSASRIASGLLHNSLPGASWVTKRLDGRWGYRPLQAPFRRITSASCGDATRQPCCERARCA
ncbi:uncharacterized protein LY79DRAFT_364427 [Colletotrichum navitas]|uniref:Uncharacterized protein n=1 Tax=Colletotrichum navitas TaxID=681940 RepID=A0AAD8PRM2_9PEZI|nr:uncharacterized protein LY79DRAFT_364427 [Colletotrichum navitas]KAK1574638.1 hypothetical protein LY79DRAFT_364427 [Colletotrichum navitas]